MKPKKDIRAQVREEYPEFAAECDALSKEAVDGRLAGFAKSTSEVETARDDDEKLEQAKAEANELGAPYRDALKAIKLKTKYLVLVSEEGSN